MLDVAIGAYILIAPALFLLLRLRFACVPAAVATLAVMVFPPLTDFALRPLTDGAGLLLVLVALIAIVLTVERSRWWLVLWLAAVAVGSITRESIAAAVLAAAVLALRRVRNAGWLLLTGIGAIAPAMLLVNTSYWRQLAEVTASDFNRPAATGFGHVALEWVNAVLLLPLWDVRQAPVWAAVLLFTLFVFVCWRERTVTRQVMTASLIGSVVYLASLPNSTDLRLEFVLLPVAAYAIARSCERSGRLLGVVVTKSILAARKKTRLDGTPNPRRELPT